MSEWKEAISGEVLDLISGYAFKSKDFKEVPDEDDLPVIKIKNVANGDVNFESVVYHHVSEKLAKYILEKGDILIAMTGNHPHAMTQVVGDVSRYKLAKKGLLNQRVGKLVAKDDNCLDFFYYYFKYEDNRNYLANQSSGSANQANISKGDILGIPMIIPEPEEQKAIAEVLSSLDDKIDLLHRQNQTLEQMAETLFRQWFVEAIQKIEFEGNSVEGFHLDKFTKWIEGTLGGEWGKENPQGDYTKQVYCIRGTDLADLNTGLPLKIPTRFVKENKFKKIKPEEGDLIIEISGGTETQSTGRVTYINPDVENLFDLPLIFSNFCRMIKVKKPQFSFFIYCYIKYLYNQDEFFNLENGSSGIKNLDYKALLLELDYPMPEEETVLKFHEAVEPLFEKINKNKTQIRTLTALRDTLLPKLMSGEIRLNYDSDDFYDSFDSKNHSSNQDNPIIQSSDK
ncbi:MAG: restriction endonuclease subunit S [Cyclobacteriaceae bacterium]|nr:restriction endonuclease subunit S [Cyclobacteriaceae bacterium]